MRGWSGAALLMTGGRVSLVNWPVPLISSPPQWSVRRVPLGSEWQLG